MVTRASYCNIFITAGEWTMEFRKPVEVFVTDDRGLAARPDFVSESAISDAAFRPARSSHLSIARKLELACHWILEEQEVIARSRGVQDVILMCKPDRRDAGLWRRPRLSHAGRNPVFEVWPSQNLVARVGEAFKHE